MNVLVILQGPAYGDERAYNGLRLAGNLARREGVDVRVFCFGDAVSCAIAGQQLPTGEYHLDRMIVPAARHEAITHRSVAGNMSRWSSGTTPEVMSVPSSGPALIVQSPSKESTFTNRAASCSAVGGVFWSSPRNRCA